MAPAPSHSGRLALNPPPGGSRFPLRAARPMNRLGAGAGFRRGDRAMASGPSVWGVCLSAPVARVVSRHRGNPGVQG